MKTSESYGRVDKLLQHVNNRIIEKYKGFREAFRKMDRNFDGSLNFREFMQGMQEMGISLTLPDYRLIFDKIDYNDEGEIDYFKFCLLDYDKEQLRQKLSEGQTVSSGMFRTTSKSSGVHQRYPDGVVPKNKDPSSFVANIQEGLRT